MGNSRVSLIIEGRVQGVWFRDSTCNEARAIGVCGWVRNRRDGKVEALLEVPEQGVKDLIEWCRHGPPHARVSRVQESQEEWTGEFKSFDILF